MKKEFNKEDVEFKFIGDWYKTLKEHWIPEVGDSQQAEDYWQSLMEDMDMLYEVTKLMDEDSVQILEPLIYATVDILRDKAEVIKKKIKEDNVTS